MYKKFCFRKVVMSMTLAGTLAIAGCETPKKETKESIVDPVEVQMEFYSNAWDEIINNARVDYFNDSIFTEDIIIHAVPENIVGIDNVKAYYENYLTGFSDISFTIKDIFGQGDKIVKHWNFSGTHTGDFFGIPPTGKLVSIDGVTLVKMYNGKIAEEQDFMDNLDFMTQLGLMPAP